MVASHSSNNAEFIYQTPKRVWSPYRGTSAQMYPLRIIRKRSFDIEGFPDSPTTALENQSPLFRLSGRGAQGQSLIGLNRPIGCFRYTVQQVAT